MALGPVMKRAVRRVADILGAFAHKQGWSPVEYRVYYQVNKTWGRLHFIFVSDGFDGRDDLEIYQSVMDYLEKRLSDEPELFEAVELVVESFRRIAEGGLYSIGDQYSYIRPRNLEKVTLRVVPELVGLFAKNRGLAEEDHGLLYKWDLDEDRLSLVFSMRKPINPGSDLRGALAEYLRTKLFDDPEVLQSFDVEVSEDERTGPASREALLSSGYRDYYSLSPAR